MKKLRMLSLCTGIGGADLAAEWTEKIEVVGQVEINPFCQEILRLHWPSVKLIADIREVEGHEFGSIDLIVGGIPCQPFSHAGKRRGKDDNRFLWPEMLRIIKRCKPAWVVVENVDGFTSLALDGVCTDLENQGYSTQAYVLPACAVNAPHERSRCFVMAHTSSVGRETRRAKPEIQPGTTNANGIASPNMAKAEQINNRARVCKSRMARMLHGISARMDGARWPSLPSHNPQRWEPPRIVTGKIPNRGKRIEALGNTIVPYQIFPLFMGIVECEEARIS